MGFLFRYAVIVSICIGASASAVVITFSEQPSGEGALSPTTYTSSQGLPVGLTATFAGFTRFDGDPDHTLGNSDNKLIYGSASQPTITFNSPVTIPSLWTTTGPIGNAGATITGFLAGQSQFSFQNSGPLDTFKEVTSGAGHPIDQLRFTSFLDNELDDISIVTPEPSTTVTAVAAVIAGAFHRRRFSPFRISRRLPRFVV